MRHRLSAFGLCAPVAALLVLWAALIPHVEVNPRLLLHLEAMAPAGFEGIRDGALVQHLGVSPLPIMIGMVLALVFAIPLGVHKKNSGWKRNITERTDRHI